MAAIQECFETHGIIYFLSDSEARGGQGQALGDDPFFAPFPQPGASYLLRLNRVNYLSPKHSASHGEGALIRRLLLDWTAGPLASSSVPVEWKWKRKNKKRQAEKGEHTGKLKSWRGVTWRDFTPRGAVSWKCMHSQMASPDHILPWSRSTADTESLLDIHYLRCTCVVTHIDLHWSSTSNIRPGRKLL